MKRENLPGAQQESLLTLLCFDDEAASLISGVVDVELFESEIYRNIADHAIGFYETYGSAVGEHLDDVLANILEGDDYKKAEIYDITLRNIFEARDSVKKDYVINNLKEWVGNQRFKKALSDAANEVHRGRTDEAKLIVNKALINPLQIFNSGTDLTVSSDVTRFLSSYDEYYDIGISGFTHPDIKLGPAPKTLLTFLAPTSRGKSWFLTNVGRWCAQYRLKVLDITLEMSEDKKAMRYVQNVMSITKNQSRVIYRKLKIGEDRSLEGLELVRLKGRPTLKDRGIRGVIQKRFNDLKLPITIKEFPTGGLSVSALEVYLDFLERHKNFIPDVILIDYADLMEMDANRVREETGRIYKQLRGLAVKRGVAVVTASQSNRLGEDARTLTLKHIAEDYTKASTSDMIVTYSQTSHEKKLGIARLWIAKNRDNLDNQTFVITQAYDMGQFCMSCYRQPKGYFRYLEEEQ